MCVVQGDGAAAVRIELEQLPGLLLGVRVSVSVEKFHRRPADDEGGGIRVAEMETRGVVDSVDVVEIDTPALAAGFGDGGQECASARPCPDS
jgi:hypothetical protein